MAGEELSKEKLQEIADALERVKNELPWQQSVFLKALGKKFEKIHDEFLQNSGLGGGEDNANIEKKDPYALNEGQVEVFISVYNAQGGDLKQWMTILTNLTKQSVSRPTYSTEKAMREMIRSKTNLVNEAYVMVHVNKEDLLDAAADRAPRDKLGNILLTLKEHSITTEKILKFYHKSGIYSLHKGEFKRLEDMNYAED